MKVLTTPFLLLRTLYKIRITYKTKLVVRTTSEKCSATILCFIDKFNYECKTKITLSKCIYFFS